MQDYQFKFPNPFPQELEDIQTLLSSADKILYMAEFFSDCVKQIRIRLGPTDTQLAAQLDFLSPSTKKSVIDDSFGDSPSFVVATPLPKPLKEYLEFLDFYYEVSSIGDIDMYEETSTPTFGLRHEDIEYLTSKCKKLRSFKVYVLENTSFSDESVELLVERCPKLQIVRLVWTCANLTDRSLIALGKLPDLLRASLCMLPKMTDAGLIGLTKNNKKMEELNLVADSNFTDAGIVHLPPSLLYFISGSPSYTSEGVCAMVQNTKKLVTLDLSNTPHLDDKAVIEILKNCDHIGSIDIRKSTVTSASLNTVPLPASLTKITIPRGIHFPVPTGSKCQIWWPNA